MCILGVAERNIECWLAANRAALATEFGCPPDEIPADDPSGFVKRRFGLTGRDPGREVAKDRVKQFILTVSIKRWIEESESFAAFYDDARTLSAQLKCDLPNERDRD